VTVVVIPVAVIAVLIGLNALFVAAEFSIVAAPRTRMAQLAEGGSASAQRVLTILRDPNRQNLYLATAQLGITAISLALGMYGEHKVAAWLLGPMARMGAIAEPAAHTIATLLATGILTYLHVVFGELTAKSVGIQTAETTALRLSGPMNVLQKVFFPLIWVLNGIGNAVTRLLGVPPADTKARLMTTRELELIVEESFERGYLEPRQQLFIENIFDFADRTIGQVMTPRTRITGIQAETGPEEVQQVICETRFSRYPVYVDDLDEIVGILHVKDYVRHQLRPDGPFDLRALARPAIFAPETVPVEEMLTQLQSESASIAVVLDEYGGTAGLVTVEDLVEEVVGEILDEFDQEIPPMQLIAPRTVRVRGDTLLDELNQHFDLALSSDTADTIGGLFMAQIGRIAQVGDTMKIDDIELQVESVDSLAIQTVMVRLPERADEGTSRQDAAEDVVTDSADQASATSAGLEPKER
jgi:CBS domain containing-hemolysin-like protein